MKARSLSAALVIALTLLGVAAHGFQAPSARATSIPTMIAGAGPVLQREFLDGAALFQRIWTVDVGLGPFINAQTCMACHTYPGLGGTAANVNDFVLFSPEASDPTGGHAFARFEVRPNAPAKPRELPRRVSKRRPPSLFGLGLLEAVAAGEHGALQGHARGRFGWKARFRTIDEAVAAAFINELGLTSPHTLHGGTPEISVEDVRLVSQFVRLLPPPLSAAAVPGGRRVFESLGCGSCHSPAVRTSASALSPLQNRSISPYTDLKLHDLGDAVSDGWDDGGTGGAEFRTPALWGLHSRGGPYLHDGRASTLQAAIEAHGGEAAQSRSACSTLSAADRERLLRFLGSL